MSEIGRTFSKFCRTMSNDRLLFPALEYALFLVFTHEIKIALVMRHVCCLQTKKLHACIVLTLTDAVHVTILTERLSVYQTNTCINSFRFCQVQDRFSASYSSGQSLLTKINDTLSNMDDGLKCFDNAKTDAKNASHTAELAFNISENAKEVSFFRCRV